MMSDRRGFTMPEVLVVITVFVGFLAGANMLIKPHNFLARDRDSERRLALAQLYETIELYKQDTGAYPAGISEKPGEIGSDEDQVDLCKTLVPSYLPDIPIDPISSEKTILNLEVNSCNTEGVSYASGYIVYLNDNKHLTLLAPGAEEEPVSLSK